MQPSPQPHPLRPGQRLALGAGRAAFRVFGAFAGLRRARAGLGRPTPRRYGTRRGETLEILPADPAAPPRPPLVYVHGGGWIFGQKELYSSDLQFLTQRGYTVYNVDYPLAPEHPFPIALHSLAAALTWIAEQDDSAGEIHLMGDSAGGNLVMMLGLLCTDPKLFEPLDPALASLSLPTARSVVSLYGVLDRTSWLEHGFPGAALMLHCYGGPNAFEEEVGPELGLTPMDWPVAKRPPCLLAIGTKDQLAESSRIASRKLRESGERLDLIEYPDEAHGFFNFGRPSRPAAQKLRADVLRFLEEV